MKSVGNSFKINDDVGLSAAASSLVLFAAASVSCCQSLSSNRKTENQQVM